MKKPLPILIGLGAAALMVPFLVPRISEDDPLIRAYQKKRRETGEPVTYLSSVASEPEPCSDFDFVPPTREQLAEFQKNRPEIFAACNAIEAADAKRARKAAKRARDAARTTKVKA